MSTFDFTNEKTAAQWRAVDDRVMGGVSRSEMAWSESFARFQGTVSPENNGGFASVRAPLPNKLSSGLDHLKIVCKGDGKLYSISLRTSTGIDGINYQAGFKSLDKFTSIEFPLTDFRAEYRGRAVTGAQDLRSQDIVQIGLLISDKQFGQFQLDVQLIDFFVG